jgi:hypothetical protein
MRRGFKTWAEQQAAEQRRLLGLSAVAPLAAERLAVLHGIEVRSPREVSGMPPQHVEWLLRDGPSNWSALILLNTAHSPARQQSNLMHEIAHVLCGHEATTQVPIVGSPYVLRGFDAELEEEAAWLGACLQLPRAALCWAMRRRMTLQQMAEHFQASVELVRYRHNVTGIARQYGQLKTGS